MKQYKRIIAAVDFSSHAPYVAEHAASLARELKAELVFVNVINQRDIDAIYFAIDRLEKSFNKVSVQRCIDQLHEEREAQANELRSALDLAEVKHRFIVRSGTPFQELLEAIKDENADLLIMGIKGRSDLAEVMMGSTALKMFKRCPVPLMTVRKDVD